MNINPADEAPIDTSLDRYVEERALEIALDKAISAAQRSTVEHLVELRASLMRRRATFGKEAIAKRHARGEIYSRARVAAINAMVPSKPALERDIRSLYLQQTDSDSVLMAHARTHFVDALMSSRLLLDANSADVVDAAREMQRHEEAFASVWAAAVTDPSFQLELRQLQREALRRLRTSTRPMYFVAQPDCTEFNDLDAQALGKAWNKLDDLALSLGVEPLSTFIALPDEGESAGAPSARLLPTVEALTKNLQRSDVKLPSKRAAIAALTKIRDAVQQLPDGGWACFEVDT